MAGLTLRLSMDAMGVKQGARDAEAAFNRVKASANQTASAVDQVGSRSLNPMKRMGAAIDGAGGKSKNLSLVMNNMSNQIGDFAVQVSMGTSAIKALGMQAPQAAGALAMLGGPFVAIATVIGLVAAVGLPLISLFMNMGTGADSLKDKMESLVDVNERLAQSQKLLSQSVSDIIYEYQGATNAVIQYGIAQAELRMNEARRRLQDLREEVQGVAKDFTEVGPKGGFSLELLNIQNEAKLTGAELSTLRGAFKEVAEAPTLDDQKSAMESLLGTLDSLGIDLTTVKNEALLSFTSAMTEFGLEAEESAKLVAKLNEQILLLQGITATPLEDPLSAFGGEGADIKTFDGGISVFGRWNEPKKGKTAAQKALDKEKTELENFAKTFKPVLTATQEYQQNMEKLNRAREIGAITEKEHAAATTIATQKYQIATGELIDYTSVANAFANSLENSIMSLVDGTMSVQDAFKSMATMVIKELFRVLVVQRMVNAAMGIFGYAPAMGGGYVKMPPVSGVGAYGGPVTAGQGIVVGERGPEIFYPQTNGTIQPNNSGGQVVVNQTFNVSTGVQQTVRAEIRTLMPQIADAAKSAVVDAKRRGGSFGRAFS